MLIYCKLNLSSKLAWSTSSSKRETDSDKTKEASAGVNETSDLGDISVCSRLRVGTPGAGTAGRHFPASRPRDWLRYALVAPIH